MNIANIAAYKFVAIADRGVLRGGLLQQCTADGLKGTILLAPEGINLFLAGAKLAIAFASALTVVVVGTLARALPPHRRCGPAIQGRSATSRIRLFVAASGTRPNAAWMFSAR